MTPCSWFSNYHVLKIVWVKIIISRPGQSQELLYKLLCNSLTNWLSDTLSKYIYDNITPQWLKMVLLVKNRQCAVVGLQSMGLPYLVLLYNFTHEEGVGTKHNILTVSSFLKQLFWYRVIFCFSSVMLNWDLWIW